MDKIKFNTYAKYVEDTLNALAASMYEDDRLDSELKFAIYYSSGEYNNAIMDAIDENEEPAVDKTIIGCFTDGGGLINSDTTMLTYSQFLNMQFLALEDQHDDLACLLNQFALNYKHEYITFYNDDKTESTDLMAEVKTLAEISDIFKHQGNIKFTAKLMITFINYDEVAVSDAFTLYINDVEVPYTSITPSRTTKTVGTQTPLENGKFWGSFATQTLTITGKYFNLDSLNQLYHDSFDVSSVNTAYNIRLERNGDSWSLDKDYISTDSTFSLVYGAVVEYKVTFQQIVTI